MADALGDGNDGLPQGQGVNVNVATNAELIFAAPMFRKGEIEYYVIVARTSADYVTATLDTLDDAEWCNGRYFADLEPAMIDAYDRTYMTIGSIKGLRPLHPPTLSV